MTLIEFVRDVAPNACGVNPNYGKAAELILTSEIKDGGLFPADGFASARERALLLLPYAPPRGFEEQYERMGDVVEMKVLEHEEADHSLEAGRYDGQDTVGRKMELEVTMDKDALSLVAEIESFWNS